MNYVLGKRILNILNHVIWMWIDWYQKYQPAEPEHVVCWRLSDVNESQASYSVEQDDIFQYQSYSHSEYMFIILKSNINTNTSILLTRHQTSYSGWAGWYFRYQSIHIQITYIYQVSRNGEPDIPHDKVSPKNKMSNIHDKNYLPVSYSFFNFQSTLKSKKNHHNV
jgi:hypothetical protein